MRQSAIFFLLWINFFSPAKAQNAQQCMEIARHQIALGNDIEARNLLQRVVYFDRKTFGKEAYFQLAYLNLRLKSYQQSEFYFDLVYQNATSDTLQYEALIGKAGALLFQSKYTETIAELLNIPDSIPDYWKGRKAVYLGAAYYGKRDFAKAETYLLSVIPETSPSMKVAIKKHLKQARKINKKNPKTAQFLSMVLPGLGQFYAGDYKNGFNSLGLNAAMAWWFIYTMQHISLGDAVLTTGSWVFRYYAGGFSRAPHIAEDVKQKRLNRNFIKMMLLLE